MCHHTALENVVDRILDVVLEIHLQVGLYVLAVLLGLSMIQVIVLDLICPAFNLSHYTGI